MYYVVGSGPAGVSCAKALIESGEEVTMLDVGLDLEDERKGMLEKLKSATEEDWGDRDSEAGKILQKMKQDMMDTMENGELPTKLRYGSDYPYRDTEEKLQLVKKGVKGSASFARGGLTTVWGSQMLPYREQELQDWPISYDEMQKYYMKTSEMFELAAENDELAKMFPIHHETTLNLERSRQARSFYRKMDKNRKELEDKNIYFGYSRLALRPGVEEPCHDCGMKIFGSCPDDSVYSAHHTLEKLEEYENFSYRDDVIIEKFDETPEGVKLEGKRYSNGSDVEFEGEKAFLGCGAISTTKILLNSLQKNKAVIKETPYFVLPLFRFQTAGDVTEQDSNTLSQIFMEITDSSISYNPVHLQVYTYNDLYPEMIKHKLGPLHKIVKPFMKPLLSRMIVIQGYMHSSHSSGIEARLENDKLQLEAEISGETKSKAVSVSKKLFRNIGKLGALPLLPLIDVKEPGDSFHLGGGFPMSENPSEAETDILGRPEGFDRVHIVDSTVFPEIHSTTIVPSIMANAYRIGDQHDQ